jgi:hypothetical protein
MGVKTLLMQDLGVFVISMWFIKKLQSHFDFSTPTKELPPSFCRPYALRFFGESAFWGITNY